MREEGEHILGMIIIMIKDFILQKTRMYSPKLEELYFERQLQEQDEVQQKYDEATPKGRKFQ